MVLSEFLLRLPDREHQVQELAHGVADGDGFVVGMLGDDARIEGADGGIETDGAQGRHPEIAAHEVVAALAHDVAPSGAGPAVAIDAGADFDGHDAEVGDEFAGRVEAVDVEVERVQEVQ